MDMEFWRNFLIGLAIGAPIGVIVVLAICKYFGDPDKMVTEDKMENKRLIIMIRNAAIVCGVLAVAVFLGAIFLTGFVTVLAQQ